MRRILSAATVAVALMSAAAAHASTLFQFDAANSSIAVTDQDCWGTCSLSASLAVPFANLTLEEGASQTFNFANFNLTGFGFGSAQVEAVLAFTTPVSGPAETAGSAGYGTFFGIISGGALTWNDPIQQFTATDGSIFTVAFGDIAGLTLGGSATAPVTITLDRAAVGPVGAVPEPMTWALLIGGFGLTGVALRRRHRVAPAALAA